MTEPTPRHATDELEDLQTKKSGMQLSNKAYDQLTYIAQIFLPALGAFYFSLASIWHLPDAQEVVGTVTVVDTFLGALLMISSKSYNNSDAKYDGVVKIHDTDDNARMMSMQLSMTPEELEAKKDIAFKVVKH